MSVSFENVSSVSGAGLSSEHKILRAALIFPSSILAVTAAEREEAGSALLFDCRVYSPEVSALLELP